MSVSDHLLERSRAADDVAEKVSGIMGDETAATLARQLEPLTCELSDALSRLPLPDTVASRFGTVRLTDYLRANVIMVVDLALEELATAERAAMTESVRALTQVLTERYPGRTIEVRIPPYAAVQVGALSAGPSHTRGTPPNVVEFAPETFWELATGRQSWQRAAASGTLTRLRRARRRDGQDVPDRQDPLNSQLRQQRPQFPGSDLAAVGVEFGPLVAQEEVEDVFAEGLGDQFAGLHELDSTLQIAWQRGDAQRSVLTLGERPDIVLGLAWQRQLPSRFRPDRRSAAARRRDRGRRPSPWPGTRHGRSWPCRA